MDQIELSNPRACKTLTLRQLEHSSVRTPAADLPAERDRDLYDKPSALREAVEGPLALKAFGSQRRPRKTPLSLKAQHDAGRSI